MSSQWQGGKGSARRPSSINQAQWEENYHKVFGYKEEKKRCFDCGEVLPHHTPQCVHNKHMK